MGKKAQALCLQNRRVLILDTEISKVKTGISVVDNAEGYDSTPSVFGESSSGFATGSETEEHITASDFGDAVSGWGIENKSDGVAYHAVFGKVESGISASRGQSAIGTISHLAESNEGISTHSNADTISTGSCFSDAEEGMGVGQSNETFYTIEPKFSGGVTGIGTSNQAEGKTTEAKMSKAQSGASAGQSAKGTVTSPTQETIYAGTYVGNSQATAIVLFEVYIPISYGYGGYPSVASRITLDEYGNIIAWRDQEEGDVIGIVDARGVVLGTDNEEFSVTNDTTVTSSDYSVFSNYFHLATP